MDEGMKQEWTDRTALLCALSESEDIEAEIGQMKPLAVDAFEPAEDGDLLACGPTGHGIASWNFRMRVKTASLDIDVVLPCQRVLENEETRKNQAADLRTACSVVFSALRIAAKGLPDGRRLLVTCDPMLNFSWRVVAADGTVEQEGAEWAELVEALFRLLDDVAEGGVQRIDL